MAKYIIPILILLIISPGFRNSDARLEQQFRSFSNDTSLRNASWSFLAIDLSEGKTIISHNIDQSLLPASVQKLITTASALVVFGHDHRMITELQYDGQIDMNGTLQGDLYIVGGGDPSLGSSFWDKAISYDEMAGKWMELLRVNGIRRIAGRIVADDMAFSKEDLPGKYIWEDMGNYYGTGASALAINENTYTVFFNAGQQIGTPAHVRSVVPDIPGMLLINEVTTGQRGTGDQVYIYGAPCQQERRLTGTVPLGATNFQVRGSMPDPAFFLARYFSDYLKERGIQVEKEASTLRIMLKDSPVKSGNTTIINAHPSADLTGNQRKSRKRVAEWYSPPMADLIYRANMASVNLYTENMLKLIGMKNGEEGSFDAGIRAINKIWSDRGMDLSGMNLHDGSGLSPSNRVTARQIGELLSFMWRHESFHYLYSSLPVAGRTGSLSGFFKNTPSEGVLRAKSGYLGNVRSYAGYTTTSNGKEMAFVLIINDYEGSPAAMRDKMFRLMDAITRL